MVFLPLVHEDDPDLGIDIEFYDLGDPENALGAYVGEKSEDIDANVREGGHWHIDRNALYVARGRYYMRAVGSAENDVVRAQLVELEARLAAALQSGPRSWAHALFADGLGLAADDVTFEKENAFSFEFAKNVYSAATGEEESDFFVSACADETAADELAARFIEGFASLGDEVDLEGSVWVKDRYLSTLSTARTHGRVVYGVRGAQTDESATSTLARLRKAVAELPQDILPASPAEPEVNDEEPGHE
jgi:hypothetical protein